MVFLDFEKPIAVLQEELNELLQNGTSTGEEENPSIKHLEEQIKTKRKEIYKELNRWQKVQLARHPDRPYTLYYIKSVCNNFIELHGDRCYADDKAIIGGFGDFNGETIMFIGHQKGVDTKMRQYRNFGMANPEGYRKALRLMKLAEKFNKPIVTFIDTPGAYPGLEAEERGQAEAIARNLFEMTRLKVPVICIVIGEGASGGALGIGIGDRILMLENTWYSVISPESCSSILWRSWDHKEAAAEALKLTATDMLKFGIIDGIIKEPEGGAHTDPECMSKKIGKSIQKSLTELRKIDPEKRITQRIDKFCSMGIFNDE